MKAISFKSSISNHQQNLSSSQQESTANYTGSIPELWNISWSIFKAVSLLLIWSYDKLSLGLCYLVEPLFHLLRYPVIKKGILLIILFHLLGPHRFIPVLQLLQNLVENVLPKLFSHKHHQLLWKHWNMMVDKGVGRVRKTIGWQAGQLYGEVFHV